MKFHLGVLILAVTSRLVTSQAQAIPGGDNAATNADAVAQQLGTDPEGGTEVCQPRASLPFEEPGPSGECPRYADIIFIVDRSGGIKKKDLQNIKLLLNSLIGRMYEFGWGSCTKTALISFSKKAKVEYGFESSDNIDLVLSAVNGIKNPKGQGQIHEALRKAYEVFRGDENPSPGENRRILLLTDGSTKDRDAAINATVSLRTNFIPRLLIGKVVNPGATESQQTNRDKLIADMISNSACKSQVLFKHKFVNGPVPDETVESAYQQILPDGYRCLSQKKYSDVNLAEAGELMMAKKAKLKPDGHLPGIRSTEKFLCKRKFKEYDWGTFKKSGDFIPNTCVIRYSQPCECELDDEGCIVPKSEEDPCDCSVLGCYLDIFGRVIEEDMEPEESVSDLLCRAAIMEEKRLEEERKKNQEKDDDDF